MIIACLRTGKTLVKDLTITTASEKMLEMIRDKCKEAGWDQNNTDQAIAKYVKPGRHCFMFDLFAQ